MGLAPQWRARACSPHSDCRKCVRRFGVHIGFGTRRKSPRGDARLYAYGHPNTPIRGTRVDSAVSRFRNECVGNGTTDSSGFRLSDYRYRRAHRDCRGKHRSDIHTLVVVAVRNCASKSGPQQRRKNKEWASTKPPISRRCVSPQSVKM